MHSSCKRKPGSLERIPEMQNRLLKQHHLFCISAVCPYFINFQLNIETVQRADNGQSENSRKLKAKGRPQTLDPILSADGEKAADNTVDSGREGSVAQPRTHETEERPNSLLFCIDIRTFLKTITKDGQKTNKRYGVIECDRFVHKGMDKNAKHMVIPYMLTLVPPLNLTGQGAYLFLPSYVMRTHGAKQQRQVVNSTPRKQLEPVYEI
ncbi:hypothetical protein M0R45_016900 [Rubus argutus]|uniref:DNA-directed RNA polymerase N-terminal domain-containing protein n=1 Tax=Rubus argutus TaxID=59490 RepID=A0AAW1XWC8_RUBAR